MSLPPLATRHSPLATRRSLGFAQFGQLITRLAAFARRRVVGDLLVTFGGRWVQILLGLAGNIISARALGPAEFGRFGLVLATITICGTLADAGLTYAAIRSIASYNARGDDRAYAVAGTYQLLRLGMGAAGSLLGLVLSQPIAALVLGYADLTPYLQLAFCTLFALGVSSYPGTVLVGLALFKRLGLAGVLNAVITVSGIGALWAVGRLDLGTLIAWNVILPLISTIPAWTLMPAGWLPWRFNRQAWKSPIQGEIAREIIRFGKWMGVSLLGSIIVAQGDLLLLGRLTTPAVVGVYSVALALASRLDTLNQSLYTVMMPRASRLRGAAEMRRYLRHVTWGSAALAGMLGLAAIIAQPLIVVLYGERYIASAGLFLALMVVVLFDLATSSLFLVAFPLNRPRLLALADWLRVGVLGLAGWLLIPRYGGYGAVMARLLARVTGTTVTLWALRRAISSTAEEQQTGYAMVDDRQPTTDDE